MPRPRNPFADPVCIRRKGKVWKVRFYPTGLITSPNDRKELPQTFESREEAERAAAILRAKLVEHRNWHVMAARKGEVLLLDALGAYDAHLQAAVKRGDLPEGTRRKRSSDLKLYLRPAAEEESLRVADLPGAWARDVVARIPEAKKKDGSLKASNTVSKAPGSLRAFGRWLVEKQYLQADPFAFLDEASQELQQERKLARRRRAMVRAQQDEPEDDGDGDRGIGLENVPTIPHVNALRNAIYRRETGEGRRNSGGAKPLPPDVARQTAEQPRFQTASGLRLCETLAAHTSRISLEAGTITVDRQLNRYVPWIPGEEPPLVPPKHDRVRHALVWADYLGKLEELMAWADENTGGWLFAPTRGQKWAADARRNEWDRAIALMEEDRRLAIARGATEPDLPPTWNWRPHFTRHCYGSWSLAPESSGGLGWSTKVVAKSMGHRDERTTTAIYRHVTSGERDRVRTARLGWSDLV